MYKMIKGCDVVLSINVMLTDRPNLYRLGQNESRMFIVRQIGKG